MDQLKVVWKENGVEYTKLVMSDRPVAIGRNPVCDIVLSDPYVSRQHAAIFYKEGAFHLHNLSQTNPIVFNDRWMLSHDLRADLQAGDSFTVGRVKILVGYSGQGQNGSGKQILQNVN